MSRGECDADAKRSGFGVAGAQESHSSFTKIFARSLLASSRLPWHPPNLPFAPHAGDDTSWEGGGRLRH